MNVTQGCDQMDISRPTIETSPSTPVASITHIQLAHVIRQAYKSVSSKNFSEKLNIISHTVQKL
jgi:hypothetical protein